MSRRSFVTFIAAALTLAYPGRPQLLGQSIDERAQSAARQAKSVRYNGGGCDITSQTEDHKCFFDQYETKAPPLIPMAQSTIAASGDAIQVKSYLSADRTHIYTETTFRVEEIFKSSSNFKLAPAQTLIADQLGGAIKLPSGQIVHDGTRDGFMGRPRVGGRYLLFLKDIHEGKDLMILSAYELRDGRVFKLAEDGSPGEVLLSKTPNKPDSFSDEQELLQTIKRMDHP